MLVSAPACSDGDGQGPPAPSPERPRPAATATSPTSTGSDTPPPRDLADLAKRYRGLTGPLDRPAPPAPALGDTVEFNALILPVNLDQPPSRTTVSATLRAVSEHAYFFVQPDPGATDEDVHAAVRAFEEEVWPRVTETFGLPPIPGVDGDPRITLLHAGLGDAVGGYVAAEDAYLRAVAPYSNEAEIIYLNLNLGAIGSPAYIHILAHEFQHLVHQRYDEHEEAWVNEGLSEAAAGLVGGGSGPYGVFLNQPNTQLNAWSTAAGSSADYGASGLFFSYLLEQTGTDATALVASPAQGVEGVRAFLDETGEPRTFEQFVADWAVANLLDRPEGPYGYREQDVGSPATEAVDALGPRDGELRQFAAAYLELEAGDFDAAPVIVFNGETEVPVAAPQETAEGGFWWSNRGDSIDSTLTREIDLTGAAEATLTFRTWFDIERDFDYGYVAVSSDGGRTWSALAGEHTTEEDPLGVSYGPGYSGRSGEGDEAAWVDERVDLSPYAGSRILLRFEYVTDDSAHGQGWAIDGIRVAEAGFFDDGDTDVGGWHREGFRRVTEPLPQTFELRLVTFGPTPEVTEIALDGENDARVPLTGLGVEYDEAVLVVVPTTGVTMEPGRYRYEVVAGSS